MNPEDIPLRDLHLPLMTGWWPPAPGWWLLIALILIGIAWSGRGIFRRWRYHAARRLALRRLAHIRIEFEHGASAIKLGKELSELIRRAMLAYAPRNTVAGLTGDKWLEWLDRGLEEKLFSEGAGRILESLPYMNPRDVDNDTDVRGLIDAVQIRLKRPQTEVTA